MDNANTRADVMRAIGAMERELPPTWSGPSMWADLVQEAANLICDLKDHLSPMQLAVVMTFGAMAHRQCKAERAGQGEVGNV